MAVSLSAVGGAGWQFFDDSGVPLAGGKLAMFDAGTTTPRATYTDNTGTVANPNPVILDAAGRPPEQIWLDDGFAYKVRVLDATDVEIRTYDYVYGIAAA